MNRGIAIPTGVLLVVLAIVFFGSRKESTLTDQMDPAANQSYSEVPEMEVSTSRPSQAVVQEPVEEEVQAPDPVLEEESATSVDNESQTAGENTPVNTGNRKRRVKRRFMHKPP